MTINLISTQHSVHHSQVEWDLLCKIISQFAYFDTNKTKLTSTLFVGQWAELVEEFSKTQIYLKEIKDEYRQVMNQLLYKLPVDNSLDKHLAHISKQGVLNFGELNKLALMMECAGFIRDDFPQVKVQEFQTIRAFDFQSFNRKFLHL